MVGSFPTYIAQKRPQLVARQVLDDVGAGTLTSSDNVAVFSSEDQRVAFRKILKEAESEANAKLRG